MGFFELYFNEEIFDREETMVCCPFPHHTAHGLEYYESKPSAGVNIQKGLFHCLSCGKAYSEVGFIAQKLGCSYEIASRLKEVFETNEHINLWKDNAELPNEIRIKLNNLGVSDQVIEELNIRSEDGRSISFPVTMYGAILDMRNYRPQEMPKIRSRKHAIAGLILPYDAWIESNKEWTLLCAGEKDMAVARSHGFNAISLTGGEQKTPVTLAPFKNKKIAIAYDNDEAGHSGAKSVAAALSEVAKEVKIISGFHDICKERGEDITDFFMKYNRTREDLIHYIKTTAPFTQDEYEEELEKNVPTVTLMEAARPQHLNKLVRSNLQIIATNDASFVVPTSYVAEKKQLTGKPSELLQIGDKRFWHLTDTSLKDILHFLDNKFTEEQINENMKNIVGIPSKEGGVSLTRIAKDVVFKCTVTDLIESNDDETSVLEYTAYSIGKKLESGKKYKAIYKLVPHPYDGQRLIMLIKQVQEATDSVTNFKVTEEVITRLNVIKNISGTVEERVNILTNKTRGLTKFNTDATLIQAIDLSFNTVLEFNFRNFKNVRGYLDTIVVTESRVGKSSTAEALRNTYGLGVFTSLAGSSATVAGIIGGSNKVNGSFQTRAGLIPQNHRGLIIFEELAKCNAQMLKELTDVKSSNRARITRVNGSLDLPALVRMISLTNTKNHLGGPPRPITSYPNGIEILTDLIGTAEDIARFDLMLVQSYRGTSMDPFWEQPEPLPDDVYKTRIRWVWSRKPTQVIISHDIETYIINQCNLLNESYDAHIKIFGTEAWKKISRLAIAVAGYLVSTDDSYENIIVTTEHVDFAINFYTKIYDNDTFRLKEYVTAERRFEQVDEDSVRAIQSLYLTAPAMLVQLETSSTCTRPELMAATGLQTDQFNAQMNQLVQGSFVRFQGQQIVPTLRFRKSMAQIDRRTTLNKIGGITHELK
jgi:hypothetical protein